MRVRLTPAADDVLARVTDADDLGRLSVQLEPGVDRSAANARLVGAVRLETETQAWIDPAWLRRAAGCEEGERAEQFAAMVEVARRHGWVDPATGEVAAHVERAEAAA